MYIYTILKRYIDFPNLDIALAEQHASWPIEIAIWLFQDSMRVSKTKTYYNNLWMYDYTCQRYHQLKTCHNIVQRIQQLLNNNKAKHCVNPVNDNCNFDKKVVINMIAKHKSLNFCPIQ